MRHPASHWEGIPSCGNLQQTYHLTVGCADVTVLEQLVPLGCLFNLLQLAPQPGPSDHFSGLLSPQLPPQPAWTGTHLPARKAQTGLLFCVGGQGAVWGVWHAAPAPPQAVCVLLRQTWVFVGHSGTMTTEVSPPHHNVGITI